MPTAEYLELRPGQPFLHFRGAAWIWGIVYQISGSVFEGWVEDSNIRPLDEHFPVEHGGFMVKFAKNDPGFQPLELLGKLAKAA